VKITAVKAAEILTATEGKIFSVKFVKRTTGEVREMVARTGVKAHLKEPLKGAGRGIDSSAPNP